MILNKKIKKLFILIIWFLIISCTQSKYYSNNSIFVLDTVMSIKIEKSGKYNSGKVLKKAVRLINKLNGIFNVHITGSEISRVNKTAHKKPVTVSETLLYLLKKSLYFAKITNGAFDPSMLAVNKLWDFKNKNFTLPSREKIAQALKKTGYKNVIIKGNTVLFKKHGMGLDLGGIAKGFIIDKVVFLFKKYGVKSAYINIGGDVYLIGKNTEKDREWFVGIQHPRNTNDLLFIFKAQHQAVVTSGDYERYKFINSKRYHHIIDPSTGYPANKSVSMSVVADNATKADALSTGFFVLGPEKSKKIASKLKNTYILSGYYKNGKLLKSVSPLIKNMLVE